ncbi:thiamine phosphate synthase [Mumia sp. ZJ1417]|uniref:thiamine phosphate synthase n=1 Tax=Mumia sp. ZJ1417 TaxID=2708082 RepID=UPI0014203F07|nr:thiamine phosphate synthase [Mumia sp. ZJ1417]QMW65165.1 thiamine phosphate synthase [Mumia sp. ZJ1417]
MVGPAGDVRLYLVTGAVPGRADVVDVVADAVDGGVTTVQLRDKAATTDDRVRLAARIAERVGARASFVLNDDLSAARAVPGAGLHVGPDDLHPARVREVLGDDVVVGWSLHRVEQLDDEEALAACSYLAVSPVWPTPTKTDTTAPWGLDGVRRLRDLVPPDLPLVAIGGISASNAASVIDAGADGICVVSAICAAPAPRAAARTLRDIVDTALAARPEAQL